MTRKTLYAAVAAGTLTLALAGPAIPAQANVASADSGR